MQQIQCPTPTILIAADAAGAAGAADRSGRPASSTRRRRWALVDRITRLRYLLAGRGRADPMATPSSQALDSTGLRDRYR